jgi:hypothetical protein
LALSSDEHRREVANGCLQDRFQDTVKVLHAFAILHSHCKIARPPKLSLLARFLD